MDRETWEFINSFAPWLGGIGSILAALVALHLSRAATKPRLRVSVEMRRLFVRGIASGHPPVFLAFRAVNVGGVPVVVKTIGWRVGLIRRAYYTIIPPAHVYVMNRAVHANTMPKKLEHGEESSILLPPEDNETSLMIRGSGGRLRQAISLWTLRGGFTTSTGHQIFVRPDSSVIKAIREDLRSHLASGEPSSY